MLTTLSGCATSSNKLRSINLPQIPQQLSERTPPPQINVGDNAKLTAVRALAALSKSNSKLEALTVWYNNLRSDYNGETSK